MPTLGPEVSSWRFHYVSRDAYDAMVECSMICDETWTAVTNKALQFESDIWQAQQNGGGYTIIMPDNEKVADVQYDEIGVACRALIVNLSPATMNAIHLCTPLDDTEFDKFSAMLNVALQRWRDLLVAQINGGKLYLQKSAGQDVIHVQYS